MRNTLLAFILLAGTLPVAPIYVHGQEESDVAGQDGDWDSRERDDRTLFDSNQRRLRRARQDRFRSFNYQNYGSPEASRRQREAQEDND